MGVSEGGQEAGSATARGPDCNIRTPEVEKHPPIPGECIRAARIRPQCRLLLRSPTVQHAAGSNTGGLALRRRVDHPSCSHQARIRSKVRLPAGVFRARQHDSARTCGGLCHRRRQRTPSWRTKARRTRLLPSLGQSAVTVGVKGGQVAVRALCLSGSAQRLCYAWRAGNGPSGAVALTAYPERPMECYRWMHVDRCRVGDTDLHWKDQGTRPVVSRNRSGI